MHAGSISFSKLTILDIWICMLSILVKVIRELSGVILSRAPKLCNFVEWRGYKVVYKRYCNKSTLLFVVYPFSRHTSVLAWYLLENILMSISCRYASLYFCMCIDGDDNELEVLEIIHHYVEILDRYFGSVSSH